MRTAAMVTILLSTAAAAQVPTLPVAAFLDDREITRYRLGQSDLDGDGNPETLVYATDIAGGARADLCGSGGCHLYVLETSAADYRLVGSVTISRPPIRVLPSVSNGWHDLSVFVAGGGITNGYDAQLRFDGTAYPSNPSAASEQRPPQVPGKTVIGQQSIEMIRAVQQVIDHLDLTTFPNSTGPRREAGKRSLTDYGFTIIQDMAAGAMLYRPDRDWMIWFRIVDQDASGMRICFGDAGQAGPGDSYRPSYDARSALVLTAADGGWLQAREVPGGFSDCENDPAPAG